MESKGQHVLYEEFLTYLEAHDRVGATGFVEKKLDDGDIDIISLYRGLLAPSLNTLTCEGDIDECIWNEHARSSIIRGIIECCHKRVIKERDSKYGGSTGERVLVICPEEEYHEIGARMVADFFTLAGFDVTFIGANTPSSVVLSAARHLKPKYLAISISSYYNLFCAARIIRRVKEENELGIKVLVGGNAFKSNPGATAEIGADNHLETFEEILALRGDG